MKTATRYVLEVDKQILALGDSAVYYGARRPYVRLTRTQYEELGKPTNITIAIWPGDRQDIMELSDFPE